MSEAIPPNERAKAISVALQNEDAVNLMRANSLESVTPTVRRVLPETAEKFYLPKTLLSVTWTRFGEKSVVVSVLVDPDEGKAVEVWSNLEVENKGGERSDAIRDIIRRGAVHVRARYPLHAVNEKQRGAVEEKETAKKNLAPTLTTMCKHIYMKTTQYRIGGEKC
jgi:hypothetical protein